jgi:curved DNA-binding protein CbpA
MEESLYEILEVSPKASAEVIKSAYRCLAQRYHPDRNPEDPLAAERMRLINQAYRVLADSLKRARYDQSGRVDFIERRGTGRRWPGAEAGKKIDTGMRPFVFRQLR